MRRRSARIKSVVVVIVIVVAAYSCASTAADAPSNTPWFFNGVRVQIFPSEKLKIEPWIINGWQSYGKFNHAPGLGGQVLWRPNGSVSIVANNYWGTDTLGNPDRQRVHTDDSIQVKYRRECRAVGFDRGGLGARSPQGRESRHGGAAREILTPGAS